jgi:hypothetical protein
MEIITNLIADYIQTSKKKNFWGGSPFFELLELGIDERGKFGEELVCRLLRAHTDLNCDWDGNKNTAREDKTIWDIYINLLETEIKTAMRGTENPTWQHEKIVQEPVWRKIIFVDIDYSGIWFTVQNHSEIPFESNKHMLLGKKSTPCKGGWKFDLTIKHLEKLQINEKTFYLDFYKPNFQGFTNFMVSHFTEKIIV